MIRSTTALGLTLAALASPAAAREVTITTDLKNYSGEGAYLAVYVTDADGAYQGTLWLAGKKAKYWRHLSDWYRATGGDSAAVDGITGASVGSGRSLTVTVDLADALFDAGYQIHVDASVEDMADRPSDAVIELTSDGAGQPVSGKGFVKTLQYDM